MSQEAVNLIKELRACSFLMDLNPNLQGTDEITLHFFAAGYRLMGNSFKRSAPHTAISPLYLIQC